MSQTGAGFFIEKIIIRTPRDWGAVNLQHLDILGGFCENINLLENILPPHYKRPLVFNLFGISVTFGFGLLEEVLETSPF